MRRRLLRALASAAAAAALLVPTTAASATGPAGVTARPVEDATAPYVQGQVTLAVDSLTPEVLTDEETLTVTGTVTNGTAEPVSRAGLVVQVQTRTEVTVEELGLWLAEERDTRVSQVLVEGLDDVPAGGTRSFSLTVPTSSLPLSDAEQWGPRGLEVVLTQGHDTVAADRTVLLWDPGATVEAARVSVVVPVAASGEELTALASSQALAGSDDEAAAALTALRERVTGLLGLAREGVVLAVDPALLNALGLPLSEEEVQGLASTTPPPSAAPTRTPSTAATTQAADPAADPATDPATTALAERVELTRALADALDTGDLIVLPWRDADLAALAHLGETDLAASALDRAGEWTSSLGPGLDGFVTGTASSADALTGAMTTALASGPLDEQSLALLPEQVATVVAYPGDLPVALDLFYTPSGTTTLGGRTVLVPDPLLSSAASGVLDDEALSALDARQLVRADSAVLVRQAPSMARDVVVTMSRQEAAGETVDELRGRLEALLDAAWTEPQDLEALVASAQADARDGTQVARSPLPESAPADGEVSTADLSGARDAEGALASLSSVLSDPEAVIGGADDVVTTVASAAWRPQPQGRQGYVSAVAGLRGLVAAGLSPAPSSTINVIAESASVPVRVVSSLDQDVTVLVHLRPGSTRLQVPDDVEVTVPAGGEATASVPITAVGSGPVEVTIELLAADGTPVGTPVTILTRVNADWESMGTRVVAGVLALVLVSGIVRTVRRGRRATPDTIMVPEEGA